MQRPALACALIAFAFSCAPMHARAASPLDGYANDAAFAASVKELDASDLVEVTPLAKTLGGRQVLLITVGTGEVHKKPAILVVGSTHGPHLLGGEVALRVAQQLAGLGKADEKTKKLLEQVTFYFIPRPTPDASEACFVAPLAEHTLNQRPTDDDHDGQIDEDGPDDLNGDGVITQMRVADPSGKFMPHPDDPRVLIEADPKKNEHGQFRVFTEGRDNDSDEQYNEDGPGGVAFDRNFTFRYPYYAAGAGPNQVSEAETRAVADFAFSHPNIAVVFSFSPEDNLMHPWKTGDGSKQRIKTNVLGGDAEHLDYMAEQYRGILNAADPPDSPKGEGSFVEWAYFHYGRWSLAARGWWPPKVAPPEKKANGEKFSGEARGADELNALRWFEQEKIDGFVNWTKVEDPDFPGKVVEVGGFRPLVRLNPPAKLLDPLAEKHLVFLTRLAGWLPRLELAESKVASQGGGVYRVEVTVRNVGFLPTQSAMGKLSEQTYPLEYEWTLPEGTKLLTGTRRGRWPDLAGSGGQEQKSWLIRLPDAKPGSARLTVGSPTATPITATLELKP